MAAGADPFGGFVTNMVVAVAAAAVCLQVTVAAAVAACALDAAHSGGIDRPRFAAVTGRAGRAGRAG